VVVDLGSLLAALLVKVPNLQLSAELSDQQLSVVLLPPLCSPSEQNHSHPQQQGQTLMRLIKSMGNPRKAHMATA
jgi:hypothetical protein